MANEPNNNADELLKRYAQKRRQQADPELHPATRRMLHGEVGRVYGGGAGARAAMPWWRKVIAAPQFGWALGLALVAGISLMVVKQAPPKSEIRPVEQDVQVKNKAPAIEAPVTSPGPEPVKKLPELKKEMAERPPVVMTPARPESTASAAEAPKPPGSAPLQREARRARDVRDSIAARDVKLVEAQSAANRFAAGDELTFSNNLDANARNDGGGRFFGNSNLDGNVLNQFTIRQSGNDLTIRDADGSSYTGQVVALYAGTNVFRAMGTNRTVQQQVVFTGQLYRAAAPMQRTANPQTRQVQLADDQMRVQGQATVGNTNQIQVDAQRVAPAR